VIAQGGLSFLLSNSYEHWFVLRMFIFVLGRKQEDGLVVCMTGGETETAQMQDVFAKKYFVFMILITATFAIVSPRCRYIHFERLPVNNS
jgi:hypothetical protein